MDTIKELEERLKEEKLKQKWNEIQEKLKETKAKYSGKAFGNKALRLDTISKYKSKSFYITFAYIKEVVLEGIQSINDLRRNPDYNYDCGIKLVGESFSVSGNDNRDSNINCSNNIRWRIKDMMELHYEISIEEYNNIKTLVNNSLDSIFLTPFKELKSHWSSTGGLYCTKYLKDNGCKLINLTNDEVYAIKNHPFLYGNDLLVNDLSKKIIEDWKNEEIKLDRLDVGFYYYGEYVRPTGISKRRIERLDSILRKFKE